MYFFGPLENLCCEKIINLPSRLQQGSELYRDVVCQVKHSDIQINHILLSSLSLLTAEVWSVCWGGHWNCSNEVIFTIHFNIRQSLLQKWVKRNNITEQIKQYSRGYQTQHSIHIMNVCSLLQLMVMLSFSRCSSRYHANVSYDGCVVVRSPSSYG